MKYNFDEAYDLTVFAFCEFVKATEKTLGIELNDNTRDMLWNETRNSLLDMAEQFEEHIHETTNT